MPEPDESKQTRAGTPSAREASAARAKKPGNTLLMAAQALADASPTAGTVQDVLEGRVLGHYAQGLKQYLAIRLGSPEKAQGAFAKLKDRVAGLGIDKLTEDPGVRARLYRLARGIADAEESEKVSSGTLLWLKPSAPALEKGLTQIRLAPKDGDRELLELRFARELDTTEIAFVLDLETSEVDQRLERAKEDARALFDGGSADLPRALLEAFALEKIESGVKDPEDEARLPLGTVLEERYELKEYIGSGAFADVFKAIDVAVPGHVVALKVLKKPSKSKRAKDQALRELRLIASVFHPSVVQFKDHGWFEERFWFVMPWYEGETLEARIEREPLTRQEAQGIFVALARALSAMHAAGLRHQDIKPDNIFLANLGGKDADVLPVLIDLGVAAKDAELLLAGTPTYFAPEVAAQFSYREGDPFPVHSVGSPSDVFSLALSLRNSLEPDTQPDVAAGAVDSFIRGRARELPEMPRSKDLRFLHKSLRRWMAHDPEERPTAEELAEELTVLTAPEVRRERRMRVLRVVIPVATILLMLIGLGAYALIQDARLHEEKAEAAESQRQQAVDEAAQTRETLEGQISEAEERIQSSQLSRQELTHQLAEAESRLTVSNRSLSRVRRQKREVDKQVEALRGELSGARQSLTQATRRVETLEGTLATRSEELQAARGQVTQTRARVESLEGDLRSARQAQQSATQNLERVTRERDAAQRAQTESARQVQQAERAQQQAERARQQADTQLERVRSQLAASQAEVRELRRQLRNRPTQPQPRPQPMQPTPMVNNPRSPTVMLR
ncbi:MAG: protein kinase [Myxococcota bacterium]